MSKRPRDILLATIVTFSVALSLLCPVTAIADETAAGETSNEETVLVDNVDPIDSGVEGVPTEEHPTVTQIVGEDENLSPKGVPLQKGLTNRALPLRARKPLL